MQKILVIPLRYIGDTVLCVPLLRALKETYPNAQIDVMASQTSQSLLEPCPYVHQILTEPKGLMKTLDLLKSKSYDAVFLMRKSVSMAWVCQLAGIPLRVGYDKQRFPWGYRRRGWFLTHTVRYPSLKTEQYQADSHLSLIRALGKPADDTRLALWTTPEDERAIDDLFRTHQLQDKKLAVVHAVSASFGKSVEYAKFKTAAESLLAENYTILFTGIETDRADIDRLMQMLNAPNRLINVAGKTNLRQAFALFKRITLLLTVDSGPLHLGAAANVPKIIGVYGPTNEKQWGVYQPGVSFKPVFKDLPCRPFYPGTHDHSGCPTLTGEEIASALVSVLR